MKDLGKLMAEASKASDRQREVSHIIARTHRLWDPTIRGEFDRMRRGASVVRHYFSPPMSTHNG